MGLSLPPSLLPRCLPSYRRLPPLRVRPSLTMRPRLQIITTPIFVNHKTTPTLVFPIKVHPGGGMEETEEFAVDNSEPSNTANEENTEKSQQG